MWWLVAGRDLETFDTGAWCGTKMQHTVRQKLNHKQLCTHSFIFNKIKCHTHKIVKLPNTVNKNIEIKTRKIGDFKTKTDNSPKPLIDLFSIQSFKYIS